MKAGVIAVQGDVSEHADAIERAAASHGVDAEVVEVRDPGIVPDCDVLLMPGGESTTISRLLREEGIDEEICAHVDAGKPLLATCAGLIVASRDAKDDRVATLGVLDVRVDRNAFGRQADSFEAPISVKGLDEPFPAVFIRAPVIDGESVDSEGDGDAAGETRDGVEVLASWNGDPVAVREGPVIATSFHPELTADSRIHDLAFFRQEHAELPTETDTGTDTGSDADAEVDA
ncbi:pyridoxal 5'-phosphate synthase glutaminase subunit PdxT [Halobaculum sp. CBA1158]|uniref:pyridoxal 5'-phosphate synthase glutaminase subunit PdxT n=1 Tax=Halobaculum sp. CBA1158 TaxID=2904243 RepID=UPI001F15E903|nr:pyridoxal 5'-phosphate synthase glutaminase subunit PdxT [Halobaculum sp. CBA1158]UIP00662.1 pyridoxal 5'-phosphate synthase glutaminase subunit PdxT [Halobaculum sp. CBA1158]